MSKSMTQEQGVVIPMQRAGDAEIDDSLCSDDLTMGLEAMQISASGYPAVVLVNENGVIRYHCATEMSTEELRELVTQAAAGLADGQQRRGGGAVSTAIPVELTACPSWCVTHDGGWATPDDATAHGGACFALVRQPDMGIKMSLLQEKNGSPKVHLNVIVTPTSRNSSIRETQMDYLLPIETARALASDLNELLDEATSA